MDNLCLTELVMLISGSVQKGLCEGKRGKSDEMRNGTIYIVGSKSSSKINVNIATFKAKGSWGIKWVWYTHNWLFAWTVQVAFLHRTWNVILDGLWQKCNQEIVVSKLPPFNWFITIWAFSLSHLTHQFFFLCLFVATSIKQLLSNWYLNTLAGD